MAAQLVASRVVLSSTELVSFVFKWSVLFVRFILPPGVRFATPIMKCVLQRKR
jgi:hypothetical protein